MNKNKAVFLMSIIQGDCLNKLKELKENSVDMIYLDPPFYTQKKHISKTRDNLKNYVKEIIADYVYVPIEHITDNDVFIWLNQLLSEVWKSSIEDFNKYSIDIMIRNKQLFKIDSILDLYIDVFVSILSNAKISDILFWNRDIEDEVRKLYDLKSRVQIDKENSKIKESLL